MDKVKKKGVSATPLQMSMQFYFSFNSLIEVPGEMLSRQM